MPKRMECVILYSVFFQIIPIPDIELMRLGIFSLPGQQIELGFSSSAFKIFSEKSRQRNRTPRNSDTGVFDDATSLCTIASCIFLDCFF